MKKQNQRGRTNAAAGGGKTKGSKNKNWYFTILAFLAIPWDDRFKKKQTGVLFKRYYLLEAKSIESGIAMGKHILRMSEQVDGTGKLEGQRVALRAIGILKIERLFQPLQNGVELFDERIDDVSYSVIKSKILDELQVKRAILQGKNGRGFDLLDIYWGEGFDDL